MAISLPEETRERLIASIRHFFAETLDQEVGELKARLVLDFCLEEIGPSVYNQAIGDARAWFGARIEDLEGSCYEPELPYWERKGPSRGD